MKILRPLKAIKAKCLDCMGQQRNEVKLCPSEDCPLYFYRSGKGPSKRILTDEQRKEIGIRLHKPKEIEVV